MKRQTRKILLPDAGSLVPNPPIVPSTGDLSVIVSRIIAATPMGSTIAAATRPTLGVPFGATTSAFRFGYRKRGRKIMNGKSRFNLQVFLLFLTLVCLLSVGATDSFAQLISAKGQVFLGTPRTLPNPNDFVDITAGDDHTCARKNNNTVYCWGIDSSGQAGSWTTKTCASGQNCVDRPTILWVTTPEGGRGTLTATRIDAGYNHTCIIDTLSDAYCWGAGNEGQVGFSAGSYGSVFEATKVVGNIKFSLISAGSDSTCGSGPGGLFCWGHIAQRAPTPTLINGYRWSAALSVGDLHACIIDGAGGGGIYCWGSNRYGQLSLPLSQLTALPLTTSTFGPSSRLATQASFTCSDQTNGTVQCAGENTWGQLGNGQYGTYNSTGTPQTVGGAAQLRGVSAGKVHACALDPNGYAYCWGNGFNGQLGNNASAIYLTPQAVSGGRTYRAIAAGGQHTCAIGTDNHIYCWGQNQHGQLGSGWFGSWWNYPVQALDPIS